MASPNSAISDSDRSMYTLFLVVGVDHILAYLLSNRNGEQSPPVCIAEGTTSGVLQVVSALFSEHPLLFLSWTQFSWNNNITFLDHPMFICSTWSSEQGHQKKFFEEPQYLSHKK